MGHLRNIATTGLLHDGLPITVWPKAFAARGARKQLSVARLRQYVASQLLKNGGGRRSGILPTVSGCAPWPYVSEAGLNAA